MTCVSPWAVSLPDCREEWQKKCATNPITGEEGHCLNFVRQEILHGRATMDASVRSYCSKSKHPLCSCVSLPIGVANAASEMSDLYGPISCWYKECTADRLLTLDLYNESMTKQCPRPKCIRAADDFEQDGSYDMCKEDVFAEWFRPLHLGRVRKQTEWMTTPILRNTK